MTNQATDVVAFLERQHREVERLLDFIEQQQGLARSDAFTCLVRLLAVHETAEEEVIHPLVRDAPGGSAIVSKRLEEESEAKEVLARLEHLGSESSEFGPAFAAFAGDVRDHATYEEQEEFPLLAAEHSDEVLERLRRTVTIAERFAPTHPHPHGPASAVGNLVVGPFVAIADRTRDALQHISRDVLRGLEA